MWTLRWPVSHYLSGELATVDVHYLTSLGPGAVESLQTLAECDDPYYSSLAKIDLKNWFIADAADFREMTYISQKAADILTTWHPMIEDTPAPDLGLTEGRA